MSHRVHSLGKGVASMAVVAEHVPRCTPRSQEHRVAWKREPRSRLHHLGHSPRACIADLDHRDTSGMGTECIRDPVSILAEQDHPAKAWHCLLDEVIE